ncbi:MAG: hypothetical protein MK226_23805 [Saprospiraceae bacterium]|nr:hypothetical protein [Saprospiraceae bacterium]
MVTKISHTNNKYRVEKKKVPSKILFPNTYAIDSFKIRIPIKDVHIHNEAIKGRIIHTVTESGEILESKNQTSDLFKCDKTGIRTSYANERMNLSNRGKVEQFITIGVAAKLLGSDYPNGITINNFQKVHAAIQYHGFVSFSIEAMLAASVTDCDFKKDYYHTSPNDFPQECRNLKKVAKARRGKGGAKVFNKHNNQGIAFADRRSTLLSERYLKFYRKEIELLRNVRSGSPIFANYYLSDYEIAALIRMETTVKNKKMARSLYGQDFDCTLLSFLHLSQSNKKKAFQVAASQHIEGMELKKSITKRKRSELIAALSPKDLQTFSFVSHLAKSGMPKERILQIAINYQKNKVAKSRLKKHLIEKIFPLIEKEKQGDFCPQMNLIFSELFTSN